MSVGDDILERLASADTWVADWPEVLERARDRHSSRVVTKRRVVLALVALVAVFVPLAALGAASDWWFIGLYDTPRPTSAPVVVKEGAWEGYAWQLIAFPSTTDGLCVALTQKGSTGPDDGAAMGCATFEGISRTPETKNAANMTITYLSGYEKSDQPAYIVGPVIGTATSVDVHFDTGSILHLPTSPGPSPLEHIRFYAALLPAGVTPTQIKRLAGVDENGNVVACLALDTAKGGVSPLSDCG